MRFLLYLNTVKYLKPIQIIFRIKYLFRIKTFNTSTRILKLRSLRGLFEFPLIKDKSLSIFNDRFVFNFLNISKTFKKIEWIPQGLPKLWIYNLHYFDYLNSKHASEDANIQKEVICEWIKHNTCHSGPGWDPYPTSLRIVNWCRYFINNDIDDDFFIKSLSKQGRFLCKNLEYHILGNHLFANAKALIFLGIFFQSSESDKWLKKGLDIFLKEIDEQILPDGGNFELSPMYHSIFLEDLIDIFCIIKISNITHLEYINEIIENKIIVMIDWALLMNHPDGEVSFFNDSSLKIARNIKTLILYANKLGIKTRKENNKHVILKNINYTYMQESGYIRVESSNAVGILDVAKVGPDYLPGHAHADTLSFELSIFNKRLIVNGGISTYEDSDQRHIERSTSFHSTLELNNTNSSQVWSSFRVAKRANPFNLIFNESREALSISCSHDGYKILRSKPIHKRTWTFKDNQLLVSDYIDTKKRNINLLNAKIKFIIHPFIKVTRINKNRYELTMDDNKSAYFDIIENPSTLEDFSYKPEFTKSLSSKAICINPVSNYSEILISW